MAAFLPAFLSVSKGQLVASLPFACFLVCLSVCLPACIFLPSRLLAFLPTFISVYLLVCLPTCLSVYLPYCRHSCLSACLLCLKRDWESWTCPLHLLRVPRNGHYKVRYNYLGNSPCTLQTYSFSISLFLT